MRFHQIFALPLFTAVDPWFSWVFKLKKKGRAPQSSVLMHCASDVYSKVTGKHMIQIPSQRATRAIHLKNARLWTLRFDGSALVLSRTY